MDVVSRPASLLKYAAPSGATTGSPVPTPLDERGGDRAARIQHGRDAADHFTRLETLAEVVEPIGMAVGVATHAGDVWKAVGDIAHNTAQGNFGAATAQTSDLVKNVADPEGGAGEFIHKAGQVMSAVSRGALGGMEIHQAIKNRDLPMGILGGAQVAMGLSAAAASLHLFGPALGLCALSAATKTGMMLARPDDYSRLQKVTTACEVAETVGETLLEAGIVPLAALALRVGAPIASALYANHHGVEARVNQGIDRLSGPRS